MAFYLNEKRPLIQAAVFSTKYKCMNIDANIIKSTKLVVFNLK